MVTMRHDVENAAKDLETLTHKLQKLENKAKKEALGIQHEFEELGNKAAEKILESTLQEMELIKDENRAKVNAQISEARKHLQKEAQVLAVNIMEKILERRLAA